MKIKIEQTIAWNWFWLGTEKRKPLKSFKTAKTRIKNNAKRNMARLRRIGRQRSLLSPYSLAIMNPSELLPYHRIQNYLVALEIVYVVRLSYFQQSSLGRHSVPKMVIHSSFRLTSIWHVSVLSLGVITFLFIISPFPISVLTTRFS